MGRVALYIVACLCAASVPFWASVSNDGGVYTSAPPAFPAEFAGRRLTMLPLTERERRFSDGFPGHIKRFTDGEREIIIHWVNAATRKLHPAADCFQGVGYEVRPLPLREDESGARWSCFMATNKGRRNAEHLRVCERIYDEAGESWTDVSSWYWAASVSRDTHAPWWAITVAERER